METQDGKQITLADAARLIPGRPSTNAIWRWARKGLKARNGDRVFLEHVRLGATIYTTRDAVYRFGRELAAADQAGLARSDSDQQVTGREPDNGAITDAESQLAQAGA